MNPTTGGSPGAFQSLPGQLRPGQRGGEGFCQWEPKDWIDLTPEVERFNVYGRGAYNFTPDIQGYTELSFFQVKTSTRNTPTGTRANWYDPSIRRCSRRSTSSCRSATRTTRSTPTTRARACTTPTRRSAAATPSYKTDTQRYLLGLKGTSAGWDWDMAGLYIKSDTDVTRKNFYSYDRLQQGLAGTGPYGYYRIGANANLNNPAIYDWIAPDRAWSISSENTIFDAKASRDIYKLQGGQLALAVGYQYMKEELSNPGTPGTDTGNVVGLGYLGGVRLAQHQRAVRRTVRAGAQEPRADRGDPLGRLLGRRQHVEPQDRRQVDGHPVAGAARHVGDGVPRAGPVRDVHGQRVGGLHGRRTIRSAARSRAPRSTARGRCSASTRATRSSSRKRPTRGRSA